MGKSFLKNIHEIKKPKKVLQTKCLYLEESSSLEEEECAQLDEGQRQLHYGDWNHVEQLRCTNEKENVVDH